MSSGHPVRDVEAGDLVVLNHCRTWAGPRRRRKAPRSWLWSPGRAGPAPGTRSWLVADTSGRGSPRIPDRRQERAARMRVSATACHVWTVINGVRSSPESRSALAGLRSLLARRPVCRADPRRARPACAVGGACRVYRLATAPGAAEYLARFDEAEDGLLSLLGFPDDLDAPLSQEIETLGGLAFLEGEVVSRHTLNEEMRRDLVKGGRRQSLEERRSREELCPREPVPRSSRATIARRLTRSSSRPVHSRAHSLSRSVRPRQVLVYCTGRPVRCRRTAWRGRAVIIWHLVGTEQGCSGGRSWPHIAYPLMHTRGQR